MRAVAALDAGDEAAALQVMCDAWNDRKSPALGALIERLDAGQAQRRYSSVFGSDAGETLPRLRVLEHTSDPRLSAAILGFLAEPRFTGEAELWDLVMTIVERLADPRLVPIAEDILKSLYLKLHPAALRDRICRRFDEIVRRIGEARPANPYEVALEAAVASRIGRSPQSLQHECDLLDQIYADPAADGPRLVYADLLAQRGDPRGELIVLQFKRRDLGLTAAETAAERELLDRHMAAWLGGLAPVVSSNKRGQTTFERGFVAVAEIINHAHSMWDAHEWATVEEIKGLSHVVLANAPLRALRRAHENLIPATLELFARRPECFANLESIAVMAGRAPAGRERAMLLACDGLPALRELILSGRGVMTDLIRDLLVHAQVARRLQRLEIVGPRGANRAWFDDFVDTLQDTSGHVPVVAITPPWRAGLDPRSIEYVRAPGGGYVLRPDPPA